MDGRISMDGEVSIDGDAQGDAMEASMNGRRQQQGQRTTFLPRCNLESDVSNHPSSHDDATHTLVSG